jgi:hypothetical protein
MVYSFDRNGEAISHLKTRWESLEPVGLRLTLGRWKRIEQPQRRLGLLLVSEKSYKRNKKALTFLLNGNMVWPIQNIGFPNRPRRFAFLALNKQPV